MKKLAVFALFLFCVSAYSQGLKFLYHGQELGDTLNVSVPASDAENEITIQILNDSPDTVRIMLRKEVLTDLGGDSYNTFCIGTCVDPSTMQSFVPLVLAPGDTSTSDQFHLLYNPAGLTGVCTVKYTFTARSEYVIVVNYISGEVSVADAPATLGSFSAYPNPATSSVTFQYTLANRSASDAANIVITNLVGNRVRVIPVSGNSGKKTIDLSNMVAGIYFYSMEINGKPASTKKLIVK